MVSRIGEMALNEGGQAYHHPPTYSPTCMSAGKGGEAGKKICLLEMRERMRFSNRSSTSSLRVVWCGVIRWNVRIGNGDGICEHCLVDTEKQKR